MPSRALVCKVSVLWVAASLIAVLGSLNPAPEDGFQSCSQRLDLMFVIQCSLVSWNLLFLGCVLILDNNHSFTSQQSGHYLIGELQFSWLFLTACCTPIQFLMLIFPADCRDSYGLPILAAYWILTIVLLLFATPLVVYGGLLIVRAILVTIPFKDWLRSHTLRSKIKQFYRISKHTRNTWKWYKKLAKARDPPVFDIAIFLIEYHTWRVSREEAQELQLAQHLCPICLEKFAWRERVFLDPVTFGKFHEECILGNPQYLKRSYWDKLSEKFLDTHRSWNSIPNLERFQGAGNLAKPVEVEEEPPKVAGANPAEPTEGAPPQAMQQGLPEPQQQP